MSDHKIICGKSEVELKQFEDNTFDSCVTDPPYGLEFMGKDWDKIGYNVGGNYDNHANFKPIKSEFKSGVGTKVGVPQKKSAL